jgi:hypothetical protein
MTHFIKPSLGACWFLGFSEINTSKMRNES